MLLGTMTVCKIIIVVQILLARQCISVDPVDRPNVNLNKLDNSLSPYTTVTLDYIYASILY